VQGFHDDEGVVEPACWLHRGNIGAHDRRRGVKPDEMNQSVISNQLSIEKRKRMAKNQMVQQLTWVQP
jgi:hypothetical protein